MHISEIKRSVEWHRSRGYSNSSDENCEEIRSEESTGQRRREIGRCTNRGGSSAKERNLLKNNAVLFATAIGVRRTLGYERCRVDL